MRWPFFYFSQKSQRAQKFFRLTAKFFGLTDYTDWLRLPLSRLGIVQIHLASALAAPSVSTDWLFAGAKNCFKGVTFCVGGIL